MGDGADSDALDERRRVAPAQVRVFDHDGGEVGVRSDLDRLAFEDGQHVTPQRLAGQGRDLASNADH